MKLIMNMKLRKTNTFFAKNDEAFMKACKTVNIPATTRQAGKFRKGKGLAYKTLKRKIKTII